MDAGGDTGEDWGPFGRPLFNDPSVRALSRVGVVDVGSNSVRLVVFDGAARSPAYFFNEKILCGLGTGLAESGRLHPEGRVRALSAIKRFQALANSMKLPPLSAVATAAVRDASDGPDFCADVLRETGLNIYVIDGKEEARYSAQGVLLGWPEASGLMCDIGGSSLELAAITDGKVGHRVSSALGPLKLAGVPGGKKGVKAEIARVVGQLADDFGTNHKRLYLVGGSWRAIARLDMERRGYPLTVLHEYRMTPKSLGTTLKWIDEVDLEEVRQRTGTSAARMALVPIAALVLKRLVREFRPKEIAVSSYGIREGLLYEQMPDRLRKRDPLMEACYVAEQKDARIPGFGKRLFNFLQPVFKSSKPSELRVIKAACMLHDVSWRAHPDYRHEACFDNATRANLGGLTHEERIFLGLALLHRYKNGRQGSRFEPLFDILSEKSMRRAEVLGKAMRFGAMLTMKDPTKIATLKLFPKKHVLTLTLNEQGADLFGEVAQARFQTLAQALEAEGVVKYRR
ncbi:Ppx/GppA family phosphatase [uncultured Aliiroseovarius sp.]|uniref:Ppx/GppA family phosphatase n=1 Tax=uncultured Aliiroseovarius sp. TaxID=1658783 RepID=UPI002597229F|nr:Ppx/GppA family phosphatase [uncultured Aliiroseovarius sp.]